MICEEAIKKMNEEKGKILKESEKSKKEQKVDISIKDGDKFTVVCDDKEYMIEIININKRLFVNNVILQGKLYTTLLDEYK